VPSAEEIARSLRAAWGIFLGRADAMRGFDLSVEGFWRSFFAIVLGAPGYFLTAIAAREGMLGNTDPAAGPTGGAFLADAVVGYLGVWLALPVLLALFAGRLGVSGTYPTYVVARNWASVIEIVPAAAVALAYLAGLIGSDLATLLMVVLMIVLLRYDYLVARRSLSVGGGFALAVVATDFVLNLVISSASTAVFTAAGQ
jgi:hypothetical protein